MMDTLAFVVITSPRGTRSRFLPPLPSSEWQPLLAAGLPAGWQLLRMDQPDFAQAGKLPILFDTLGPVDPAPLVASWLTEGYLVWDRHPEVERALAVANLLIARILETRFQMVDPIPLPSVETRLKDEALIGFARSWEAYELSCAKLQVEEHLLAPTPRLTVTYPRWQPLWAAYLDRVRALKVTCTAMDERRPVAPRPLPRVLST